MRFLVFKTVDLKCFRVLWMGSTHVAGTKYSSVGNRTPLTSLINDAGFFLQPYLFLTRLKFIFDAPPVFMVCIGLQDDDSAQSPITHSWFRKQLGNRKKR